jgi:uncharacterized membrane protein
MSDTLSLTTDPLWPWSFPTYGTLALLVVGVLLVSITVWTYVGASLTNARRLVIVLGLRLFALLLAILVLMRPALASRDDQKVPSLLIILLDRSESMTINDAYGNKSRWEAVRHILDMPQCKTALERLKDDHNVTVVIKCFAEDVSDFDPNRPADGKRTETGTALHKLYDDHGQERFFRGLLIASDGADNGYRFDPLAEAEKWRRRGCPIHTFALGQTVAPAKQRDIAVVAITATPSPVAVKNKFTVTAVIDAPGFENDKVPVRLLIDDKEVAVQEERLNKAVGNEVQLSTNAPDKAGEIKVTVKVDAQVGEVIQTNNEITTYLTVTKEGLSVLYVHGRLGSSEPPSIRRALQDPRIRLDEMFRDDDPLTPVQADVFRFDKQHYDVIILGDITAKRLAGGESGVLARIRDEVTKRGAGLMMIGNHDSFGNSDWRGTPIADILPVDISELGQADVPIRMVPTKQGVDRYLMNLENDPKKNQELWSELPKLGGMTRLGKEKPGAVVLASANDGVTGAPLLVSQDVGAGRALALGVETWPWVNYKALEKDKPGLGLHGRFWKQVALWLAKQEEATGNVWVRPDTRRVPAGGKQGITVGLRGKGGLDLLDATFTITVIDPNKGEHAITTNREAAGQRGIFWKTDLAGEYKIVVTGKGKDTDGQELSGPPVSARFLVYQDTAEMARQAADHEFLARLANTGGGKALRAEDLPRFLQEMVSQPLAQGQRAKTELYPDWRRNRMSFFLPTFFLVFVAVIGLEWFLRRSWGLV